MADKVTVTMSFTWTFNKSEWDDTKSHWETVNKDIESKLLYNPMNMFFCLRNITNPTCTSYSIEKS